MEIETEHFNEVSEPGGKLRKRYKPLFETLERIGEEELAKRSKRADEKLRELGPTFPLPDAPGGKDRILPADWLPRLVPKDHREIFSRGLLQRGYVISAWLAAVCPPELKLRGGSKSVFKEASRGVIPAEVIDREKGYFPAPALKHL